MGVSTHIAITRYQKGVPAQKCGCNGENDNGNGSLMRIYPIVLCWFYMNKQKKAFLELDELVFEISALTHAHIRSKLSCGIYAYVLLYLLDNPEKTSIQEGLRYAQMHFSQNPAYEVELKHFSRVFDENFAYTAESEIKSTGYVVSTLEAAIWCLLNTKCYEECVLKAVNLGNDTDTVAAIAGSLAGGLYGIESIPQNWIEILQKKDLIEDVCQNFARALSQM